MIIRTILAAFILIANIMFILVGTTPALAASEEFHIILAGWPFSYETLEAHLSSPLAAVAHQHRLKKPSAAEPTASLSDATACTHSLFEQPWWLDAVAPGAWDAATVVKDGEIVGRLPYVRLRYFGLTILGQPPLTQFLGPWIKPGAGTTYERLEREHKILRLLIAKLPKHDVFLQNFHHSMTNCLAFRWSGFSETARYTYVLDELDDHDKIWAGFRQEVRTRIRKATQQVVVRAIDDVEPFIALNRMTYERQGMSMPYSAELIRRVDVACSARGLRQILLAEDAEGIPHAGIYLVWDAESAYYLMGGSDPSLRHSGAMTLLTWEAIKLAGRVTRRYDFEGSMLRPIERFFRAFGGHQVQFPRLTCGTTLMGQLAVMAYEWSHARKHRSPASKPSSASLPTRSAPRRGSTRRSPESSRS